MIPTLESEAKYIHPLARFVTKEAIALLLKVDISKIREIRCWARVILVVGERLSKFVSYADLPPILAKEAPNNTDIIRWRKRWQKHNRQAPQFWVEFYQQKFERAITINQLQAWGRIIGKIKFAFSSAALQQLRDCYSQSKARLENLLAIAA